MLYSFVRPFIFALDAEKAHRLTIEGLRILPASCSADIDTRLSSTVAGLAFPGPVGLAPGFDKNAEVPSQMARFGFGFTEVGTVTPRPQTGNGKPRLFRLVEDRAVINRMGFNNEGADRVAERLANRVDNGLPLGINIGANKDSADRIADYADMTRTMVPLADYLTVNISSPNTPGLRALQDRGSLEALLDGVLEARGAHSCPVFLKLAPDLETGDVRDICEVALAKRLDALVISNTTITRPVLGSRHAKESGGLSGAPLKRLALRQLKEFRSICGDAMPLIGVGGIENAADAYARIRAGASLVQIYSALVYHGPELAAKINAGLLKLMDRDGFAMLSDVIGADA